MSALRMCAYGVLVLPELEWTGNHKRILVNKDIINARSEIFELVNEELLKEHVGTAIMPFLSLSKGYGTYPVAGVTKCSSRGWTGNLFGVLAPPKDIPMNNGFGLCLRQLIHKASWQECCMAILNEVEPFNHQPTGD